MSPPLLEGVGDGFPSLYVTVSGKPKQTRWTLFSSDPDSLSFSLSISVSQDQLSFLTRQYEDAVLRARRLSASGRGDPADLLRQDDLVRQDDLLVYLRWLVCHLHSVHVVGDFLRVTGRSLEGFFVMRLFGREGGLNFFLLLTVKGAALHSSLCKGRRRGRRRAN